MIEKFLEYCELVKPYNLEIGNRSSICERPVKIKLTYFEREWHYAVRELDETDVILINEGVKENKDYMVMVLEELKDRMEVYIDEKRRKRND